MASRIVPSFITSEELLRVLKHLFAACPDAVVLIDAEDRIQFWNAGAEQIFGWRNAEVIGRRFHFLIPQQLRVRGELKKLRRIVEATGVIRPHRTMRKTRDGRIIPVEITRSRIDDPLGGPPAYVAVARDLSETQKMEVRLRQSEKASALGTLIAGLAHEIGTPLNVILGNAELLLADGLPDPRQTQTVEAIMRATNRVANLLRSLMTFAREPGHSRELLNMNEVLDELYLLLERQMERKGVTLELQKESALPLVYGDRAQLQQVLLNLTVNAWHAVGDRGGVVLSTRITPSAQGPVVATRVRDTGPGIAPDHQHRLFTPFFTTKDIGEGTGLGLYVSWQIADAHGGTLHLESSDLEIGTTFALSLPLADATSLALADDDDLADDDLEQKDPHP